MRLVIKDNIFVDRQPHTLLLQTTRITAKAPCIQGERIDDKLFSEKSSN